MGNQVTVVDRISLVFEEMYAEAQATDNQTAIQNLNTAWQDICVLLDDRDKALDEAQELITDMLKQRDVAIDSFQTLWQDIEQINTDNPMIEKLAEVLHAEFLEEHDDLDEEGLFEQADEELFTQVTNTLKVVGGDYMDTARLLAVVRGEETLSGKAATILKLLVSELKDGDPDA